MRLLLATHVQNLSARKFRRTRTLIAGVVVTLGITVVGAVPALAAPSPAAPAAPSVPSTSGDAKAAWDKSSRQAEIAAEAVNGAKQAQAQAVQSVKQANVGLVTAKRAAASTKAALTVATATVASYQSKLDAFANASFRGADLSQLSVMLTATSADDYLDESTVVNKVAEDTHKTLEGAVTAKSDAAKAKATADSAAAAAINAKAKADAAAASAATATATAVSKKADLDGAVAKYKSLYNKLSAQEKAAAAAAAETARQQSLAEAAALQAQQATDAAGAQQVQGAAPQAAVATTPAAAGASSSSSSSSSASSPSAAAAPVPAASGDSAGEIAAKAALTKVGFAYAYAGDGPDAYDCSGLTTWAWAQAGISIPRVSYEQANFPDVPLDQLQPGDLVTYYSPVSHVAIYVGNGMVVSAADEALGIVLRSVDGAGPDATGHRVPRG